ncbi:class I SAM-dependent methyltransferase [Paenibacillus allorhizosphaerae]|uniref:2-methoxy-6-polyprenyl-1,4-benzoquinol methylase, mitochondrial n=1 Tax=Paenibacillus allorhizosphaerae TaxID=2849866 RepID=A0ABN7TLS7_9BACL|nr:class I SAM-dependent methyltransferase [Paenibacillus allorhizosphaerae]CAG7637300.1 2-methoxy-6-polyprenyl-1,4-benzoquinol methylase, mitochondrial [Paenibacillus allorhizosphaerae]
MKENDHLLMIQKQWDAYHPEYMEAILKDRPDYYKFFAEGGVDDSFEFRLLGDVRGLRLLDTCCACDASQAFTWTNLGAKVTACDIREVAIEIAKKNAAIMDLDVDFQVADAQTLPPIPNDAYDIVYATYLVWYEDIEKAFKTWYRVLKPGGRVLYAGVHPLSKLLQENNGMLEIKRRYHDRAPHYYRFDATAAGRRFGVNVNKPTVNNFSYDGRYRQCDFRSRFYNRTHGRNGSAGQYNEIVFA